MFGKITFSGSSQSTPKTNTIFTNKSLEQMINSNKNRSDKSDEKTMIKYKNKKIKKDKVK